MNALELHMKIAMLIKQNDLLIAQNKILHERISNLIKSYPSELKLEQMVRKFNKKERDQWLDLVDEGRQVVRDLKHG